MWGGLRRFWWPSWGYCVLALAVLTAVLSISPSHAQRGKWVPEKPGFNGNLERTNSNTVSIVSGNYDSTDLAIASDLSAILDDGDDFRVLPVVGRGQSVRDVRFLKGIDLGITQSVLLNTFRRTNEFGPLDGRIVYIAKLYNEEMHL